jgi:protein SCO1/2
MSNKPRYRFFLGLAVAFLLPLSFYLIVKLLSKDKIYLPHYYGVEKVDTLSSGGKTTYDTTFRHVTDLRGVNQLGREVSLNKDLKGKIVVVDFFFVNCPDVCPRLTGNMTLLQKAFRKSFKHASGLEDDVHLVSITVNPERDSFPALRAYAEKFGVDHDHWWFITGDKRAIYDYARNQLGVAVGPGDGGAEDFIHTEKLVLLDKERHVRGYYDGLDTVQLRQCADDMVLLTMEKKKRK